MTFFTTTVDLFLQAESEAAVSDALSGLLTENGIYSEGPTSLLDWRFAGDSWALPMKDVPEQLQAPEAFYADRPLAFTVNFMVPPGLRKGPAADWIVARFVYADERHHAATVARAALVEMFPSRDLAAFELISIYHGHRTDIYEA